MQRSTNRILTTHTGSLPRPPELLECSAALRLGECDLPHYVEVLQQAVNEIVSRQAEAGIDIVNEGEFTKDSWSGYVLGRMSGFEFRPDQIRPVEWLGRERVRFAEYLADAFPRAITGVPTDACIGPIEYTGQETLKRTIETLKAASGHAEGRDVFMTAVAPGSTAYDGVNEYYASEEEYVFALAEALREEYLAIYRAGLLVQIDDAALANMYDSLTAHSPARYRDWAQLRVEALNHALRGIPEDRVRYHICFGSWHVPHTSDAPLEEIVDLILQVNAGAYLIEAANPRHEHEWRVWNEVDLPDEKILIPGVITHHIVTVEHPRVVADRIVRYAQIVGRENLIAGTDCGFAQIEHLQRVHPSVMWAKFDSLVEGARIASAELWGSRRAASRK